MEIEKKYKVKELPKEIENYSLKQIEQGYLSYNPVVRIRKSNDEYYLTYKSKIGLSKDVGKEACVSNEVEVPLTEESYYHLKTKVDDNIITKTRYLIPINNELTAELDIFDGILKGLYFVEVEFKDEESAKDFIPPTWFGEEVSFDERFRNIYLAKVNSLSELGQI